jgi:hypothetical protein
VLWPHYFSSYFSAAQPTTALPNPPDGELPYPTPKVPSANVVFAESFKNPGPTPPVLSSNTHGNGPPDIHGPPPLLGPSARAMITLWKKCTTTGLGGNSPTCQKIRNVFDFFSRNYLETCQLGPSLPDTHTMLRQVYGWAEFDGCAHALVDTPGYDTAIADFCELEYNYLTNPPSQNIFNPYAHLIKETLKSNAYAFSIDDKAAFLSVPGDGLIITIGGPEGLAFPDEQYDLPTLATISKFCH